MLRRRQVVLPLVIKKGPVEPYWVRATTPQPPLVLQDVLFGKTPVGTFLHREWARFKRSVAEEQHKCECLLSVLAWEGEGASTRRGDPQKVDLPANAFRPPCRQPRP